MRGGNGELRKVLTPDDLVNTIQLLIPGHPPHYGAIVPDTRFNGLGICLFVENMADVPKAHHFKYHFRKMWEELAKMKQGIKP